MPAIASVEDLKAAQKEGVSIYAMRYALCDNCHDIVYSENCHDIVYSQL
jgi:hypothetical protein